MSKTQDTQTSWESVLVDGYKMPILFYNPENISEPMTTQNIAESVFQTLTTEGVSKRALNSFRIAIQCLSDEANANLEEIGTAAFVRPLDFDDRGYALGVSIHVHFDGSMKSIISLAHELVHVAQYASKRLKTITNKKGQRISSYKLQESGVIQRGARNDIAYFDRVWEWEAYAKQTYIAKNIYTTITGYDSMNLNIENKTTTILNKKFMCLRVANEFDDWKDMSSVFQVVGAVGDAKVCSA